MNCIVRFAVASLTVLALVQPAAAAEPRLDINKATQDDFVKLPKIGPAVAQRIIEYRKQNGGFRKLEDLMAVRGIGQKTFDTLKDSLSLGESGKDSTARPAEAKAASAGAAR